MRFLPILLATLWVLCGLGCQRELDICDITQRTCQERVYYTTLALRGDGYDPFGGLPPIRIITEDDFRNELITTSSTPSSSAQKAWDVAFSLLHLYPPKNQIVDGGVTDDSTDARDNVDPQIDDEATHVYAYFDPGKRSITIVSHPGETKTSAQRLAMVSLAHEFVHALQDREFDLSRSFPTFDEYLAHQTIVEGDARFYELLFENELYSLGRTPARTVEITHEELRFYFQNFDLLGSPFYAAKMLIYPLGAQYFAQTWATGGNGAVRRLYGQAPTNTLGFLITPEGMAPHGTFRHMTCQAPNATGLVTVGKDRLGALVFFTFLQGWQVPQEQAFSTAQGWRDDQLLVFKKDQTQDIGVSWRIELDQPLASTIYEKLTRTSELSVAILGNALEINAQTTKEDVTWNSDPTCLSF